VHGKDKIWIWNVFEKSKCKRPLLRHKYRWDDNNKIDITEVDICLRTRRSGGCSEQSNETYNEGRFLTRWKTVSFSEKRLCGMEVVSYETNIFLSREPLTSYGL
jgi:hypothetical protein